MKKTISLPTLFTLCRLILAPFVMPTLLIYGAPYNSFIINLFITILFIFFAITDFLDGYLARALGQETALGKVLDPIADKFLLYSTLIGLLVINRIWIYWVIIFIGREFFIMGLRLLALENKIEVPVSWMGKIKTIAQSCYLTLLVAQPIMISCVWWWQLASTILLIISLCLSLGSAYIYYRTFMKQWYVKTYEGDFV